MKHPDNCPNCERGGDPSICGVDEANVEPYACDMCDRTERALAAEREKVKRLREALAAEVAVHDRLDAEQKERYPAVYAIRQQYHGARIARARALLKETEP